MIVGGDDSGDIFQADSRCPATRAQVGLSGIALPPRVDQQGLALEYQQITERVSHGITGKTTGIDQTPGLTSSTSGIVFERQAFCWATPVTVMCSKEVVWSGRLVIGIPLGALAVRGLSIKRIA